MAAGEDKGLSYMAFPPYPPRCSSKLLLPLLQPSPAPRGAFPLEGTL